MSPDVRPIGEAAVRRDSVPHAEPADRALTEEPAYPRKQDHVRAEPQARWRTLALLFSGVVVVYGALFAVQLAQAPAVAQLPVSSPAPTARHDNRFDFAQSVPAADRDWIVQAVANARPEAIRLIEQIDSRTTVAPLRDGLHLGLTTRLPGPLSGRHLILLDLKSLDGRMRANRELVLLHELGHVVDDEFVSDSLRDRLVAEVPKSGFCLRGRFGDCAPPEEKFAETFAKWASRGALSFRYGAGYHVSVPPSLDAWGEPLTRLG